MRLPPLPDEGLLHRHVVLKTETVGAPVGTLEAPVESESGRPPSDRVATWKPALTSACDGQPLPDEVCVPGGAFWMGDPRLDLTGLPENDGERERLVVVSPFFMSQTEVTVAAYRRDGPHPPASRSVAPADNPHERDTGIPNCTFTSDPSDTDDQPVNCISWDLAQEFCEDRGGTLPSEAQLEFVMGGRRSARFVWGDDGASCVDGTFDRGSANDECGPQGVGVSDVGQGERDRLEVPGGALVDLNGNVREWASDRWNRQTEACWSVPLLVNPVCDSISDADGDARSARGGYYSADRNLVVASVRAFLANERFAVASEVGFRCARAD